MYVRAEEGGSPNRPPIPALNGQKKDEPSGADTLKLSAISIVVPGIGCGSGEKEQQIMMIRITTHCYQHFLITSFICIVDESLK